MSTLGLLGQHIQQWLERRRMSLSLRNMEQVIAEIRELNFEEARRRALPLLEDISKFKCVKGSSDQHLPYQLSGSLQQFFSTYESVETLAGEARLSRNLVGPSEYQIGFLRIGTDFDFTEIAVRPSEDSIYQIDGSEISDKDFTTSQFPSIYHWVLATVEVLYSVNE